MLPLYLKLQILHSSFIIKRTTTRVKCQNNFRSYLVVSFLLIKGEVRPSCGQLLIAKIPSYERRDLATLEGMDGVSEVIKLVIKLCNRGGGEDRGSCLEEFSFLVGFLVVLVQVIYGSCFLLLLLFNSSYLGLERKSG